MPASILLAYATTSGSTKEVAEAIGSSLETTGNTAKVASAPDAPSPKGYDAVVVGAPLYMFRWHKSARRFLNKHKGVLSSTPVAVFALGPWHDKEEEFQGAREQLDKALAKFPWLTPKEVRVFGGRFDPAKLTFPYTMIPALKQMDTGDIRDWQAIRAWAAELPKTLGLTTAS
jgi:menaquinone-dependent protoporphyrinogen oxidase